MSNGGSFRRLATGPGSAVSLAVVTTAPPPRFDFGLAGDSSSRDGRDRVGALALLFRPLRCDSLGAWPSSSLPLRSCNDQTLSSLVGGR